MKKIIISITTIMIISSNLLYGEVEKLVPSLEVTQWLQKYFEGEQFGKDLIYYFEDFQELWHETEKLKTMIQDLNTSDGIPIDDYKPMLETLAQSMGNANALSYAMGNVDENFRKHHPGYDTYFAVASDETLSDGQKAQNFTQIYKDITKETQNTVKATLKTMNMDYEDLKSEDQLVQKLKVLSQSADGNLKVKAAANDITTFQLRQVQKLQTTIMNQTNLQAEYYAGKIEKRDIEASRHEQRRTGGKDVIDGNEHQVTKW